MKTSQWSVATCSLYVSASGSRERLSRAAGGLDPHEDLARWGRASLHDACHVVARGIGTRRVRVDVNRPRVVEYRSDLGVRLSFHPSFARGRVLTPYSTRDASSRVTGLSRRRSTVRRGDGGRSCRALENADKTGATGPMTSTRLGVAEA